MEQEEVTRSRLSIDISVQERERMQRLLPWGVQSAIMRFILNGVLDIIEEYGDAGLAVLLSGKVGVIDILRRLEKEKKEKENGSKRSEEGHLNPSR